MPELPIGPIPEIVDTTDVEDRVRFRWKPEVGGNSGGDAVPAAVFIGKVDAVGDCP